MSSTRDKLRVMIYTPEYWLEGDIYLFPGGRLTDALNFKAKEFLALTDVKAIDPHNGEVLFTIDYMAINRTAIQIIYPVDGEYTPLDEESADWRARK